MLCGIESQDAPECPRPALIGVKVAPRRSRYASTNTSGKGTAMTYKTVLAVLQSPAAAKAALGPACAIARDFGAHLLGLHVSEIFEPSKPALQIDPGLRALGQLVQAPALAAQRLTLALEL